MGIHGGDSLAPTLEFQWFGGSLPPLLSDEVAATTPGSKLGGEPSQ